MLRYFWTDRSYLPPAPIGELFMLGWAVLHTIYPGVVGTQAAHIVHKTIWLLARVVKEFIKSLSLNRHRKFTATIYFPSHDRSFTKLLPDGHYYSSVFWGRFLWISSQHTQPRANSRSQCMQPGQSPQRRNIFTVLLLRVVRETITTRKFLCHEHRVVTHRGNFSKISLKCPWY